MARVTKAVSPPPPMPAVPARVRMLRPHGFFDDQGRHRVWRKDLVVTNADDIALLTERGAAFAIEG